MMQCRPVARYETSVFPSNADSADFSNLVPKPGADTLPMLAPYMITATLFRLLDSIQQFDIIYAMTQGGPGNSLMVFQVGAYLDFFQNTDIGRSTAELMVLWAVTYALSNVFVKHWHKLREKSHGAA